MAHGGRAAWESAGEVTAALRSGGLALGMKRAARAVPGLRGAHRDRRTADNDLALPGRRPPGQQSPGRLPRRLRGRRRADRDGRGPDGRCPGEYAALSPAASPPPVGPARRAVLRGRAPVELLHYAVAAHPRGRRRARAQAARRFLPEIPTHSADQVFESTGTDDSVRLDYTAEVFGRCARSTSVAITGASTASCSQPAGGSARAAYRARCSSGSTWTT